MSGLIYIPFVKTGEQLVDVFAKGLNSPVFHSCVKKLGMCSIYILT